MDFSLSCSDGSYLKDVSLERVIREENSQIQQLKSVELAFCDNGDKLPMWEHAISLRFSSIGYNPISLSVKGKDADWIKLTSLELRELIRGKVIVNDGMKTLQFVKWAISATIVFIVFWLFTLSLRSSSRLNLPTLADAIKSPDPNIKLNYLLSKQYASPMPVIAQFALGGMIVLGTFFVLTFTLPDSRAFRWLYPVNEFLIGAGKERIERRLSLREKLFWGVIVAFVVSIVASLVSSFH